MYVCVCAVTSLSLQVVLAAMSNEINEIVDAVLALEVAGRLGDILTVRIVRQHIGTQ